MTTIQTSRLVLVPFGDEHLTDRYVGWLNDPAVVRYSDQRRRSHTLDSCRQYWESFAGTPHRFWAIVRRDSEPRYIGTMTAFIDAAHGVADIGILIGERSLWGMRYGGEAWRAVIDFLFERADVRKVTAGALAVNEPMLAVMRRSGMVEDGRRVAHAFFEGQPVDLIHFAAHRPSTVCRHYVPGDRIYLRELSVNDVTDRYVGWMNDPAVTRYLESRRSRNSRADVLNFVVQSLRHPDVLFMAIVIKDGDRHIGNIKLGPIDRYHRRGDVGIVIGERDCWGSGYGTEAIRLLAQYAFDTLNLHKLTAGCCILNKASIQAFLNAGFTQEATRPSHELAECGFVDSVLLGLVRPAAVAQGTP